MNSIRYKSGYKYQLHDIYLTNISVTPNEHINTEWISLTKKGSIVILGGYCWNGASGPTVDTKNSMRGSLVHDALYQLMRMGVLDRSWRDKADRELQRICREDGMSRFRAWMWYRAVRKLAGFGADPKNIRKVKVAP